MGVAAETEDQGMVQALRQPGFLAKLLAADGDSPVRRCFDGKPSGCAGSGEPASSRARDTLQTVRIREFAPVIAASEGLLERCSLAIDGKL
jgi:hypothetical protein